MEKIGPLGTSTVRLPYGNGAIGVPSHYCHYPSKSYFSRPTEDRPEPSRLPWFQLHTLRDALSLVLSTVTQRSQTIFKVTVNPSAIRMREPPSAHAIRHILSIAVFRSLRSTEPYRQFKVQKFKVQRRKIKDGSKRSPAFSTVRGLP
jgi:hypothetical protein